MKELTAYTQIAQKIEEQEPHTAPKARDGSIHAAFIGHLELMYSPEEAEIVQHLDVFETFSSSRDVAETSGRDHPHVAKILAEVSSRNGILAVGDMYCLPPIPLLLNAHHFYPETRPGDLEAARLYAEYFIEDGFYKYY